MLEAAKNQFKGKPEGKIRDYISRDTWDLVQQKEIAKNNKGKRKLKNSTRKVRKTSERKEKNKYYLNIWN